MSFFLENVKQACKASGLLPKGEAVLLAVSGGIDSMVLLEALYRLREENEWRLGVAHFNHRLRPESEKDEQFVCEQACGRGLPFFSESADVASAAKTEGISIEMAGRKLRHAFLARTARKFGGECIALAHHADDQVETFWIRLLRGSAGLGLGGMKPISVSPADSTIKLARPLLYFSKSELANFARSIQLPFREDATNTLPNFERNKIRLELLPFLEREFQPALRSNTQRVAEVLGAEKDFIEREATKWIEQQTVAFGDLHPAVQRVVLYVQLKELKLEPDFTVIEHLRLKIGEPISVGAGVHVVRAESGLVVQENQKKLNFSSDNKEVDIRLPGQTNWEDLIISWDYVSARPEKNPAHTEFFDAEKIGNLITLRHWQPGDRYHPIGMNADSKLQDIFTNLKISPHLRRKLVVASTSGGALFWVEGLRISELFKVTPTTSNILRLHWVETMTSQ